MIRIAVASGKGGTGKTTVATSLALLLARRRSLHFSQYLDGRLVTGENGCDH